MVLSKYISKISVCAMIFILASCSLIHDDLDDKTVSVTLNISAAETVQTKTDDYAVAGEYINTLCIYVVNEENVIEAFIDATPEFSTPKGNKEEYTTTVNLIPGKKTIYAFANIENITVSNPPQSSSNKFSEQLRILLPGRSWPAKEMDAYMIDNPASSIDIANRKYIPMTARIEHYLLAEGETVVVPLVRLVSKVRAVLQNLQGKSITVSRIEMGNFADKVPLFENGPVSGVKYDQKIVKENLKITVKNGNTVNLYNNGLQEMYVNETKDHSDPFQIKLNIDGTERKGNTTTKNIPRNSVLPLALSLNSNSVELKVSAKVAPIGGMPVDVFTGGFSLTNNYLIDLPEGCTFEITGQLQNGTESAISSWSWSVDESSTSLVKLEVPDQNAIIGHLSAVPGQAVKLKFSVLQPTVINGTLTIKTIPLEDSYPTKTKAFRWNEVPNLFEPVILGN